MFNLLVAALISLLGDNNFQTRQLAHITLSAITNQYDTIDSVRQHLHHPNPEVRMRVRRIFNDYYAVWPTKSRIMPRYDFLDLPIGPGERDRDIQEIWNDGSSEEGWNVNEEEIDARFRAATANSIRKFFELKMRRREIIAMFDKALEDEKKRGGPQWNK